MSFALLALNLAVNCPPIQWSTDTVRIGTMDQGQKKSISINFQSTQQDFELDQVIAQGRGPQNIQASQKLKAQESGQLRFDFLTEDLRGQINEHISLISKNECTYPLPLVGEVRPALEFYPPQVDLGFIDATGSHFRFYVWSSDQSPFQISSSDSILGKNLKVRPVKVKITPDGAKENGNTPGFEVSGIFPQPQGKRASVSHLLRIIKASNPQAMNEVLLVGYRKQN
jgi:hypothetical protein